MHIHYAWRVEVYGHCLPQCGLFLKNNNVYEYSILHFVVLLTMILYFIILPR